MEPYTTHRRQITIDHLSQSIDSIATKHPETGFILIGDFNRLPEWKLINQYGLKQTVCQPTRENAILDKCYTILKGFYGEAKIVSHLGRSDHHGILCVPLKNIKRTRGKNKTSKARVFEKKNEKKTSSHTPSAKYDGNLSMPCKPVPISLHTSITLLAHSIIHIFR